MLPPSPQEKKIAADMQNADDLANRYYRCMKDYYPIPGYHDLIMGILAKDYSRTEFDRLLFYFTGPDFYGEDSPIPYFDEQNDGDDDDEPTLDETLESIDISIKDQTLAPLMDALCASVYSGIVNLCNFGAIRQDVMKERHFFGLITDLAVIYRNLLNICFRFLPEIDLARIGAVSNQNCRIFKRILEQVQFYRRDAQAHVFSDFADAMQGAYRKQQQFLEEIRDIQTR